MPSLFRQLVRLHLSLCLRHLLGQVLFDDSSVHPYPLTLSTGCYSIVLECVPARVAELVTSSLRIPTIGIGAGPRCSGQILVWHDLLGVSQSPSPKYDRT